MFLRGLPTCLGVTTDTMPERRLLDGGPPEDGTVLGEIAALRREQKLIWNSHAREHEQHELSHGREHQFSQTAIDTAAKLAQENKTDANEWRSSMNDREAKFATKTDVDNIMARLDKIERAGLVAAERDSARLMAEAERDRAVERKYQMDKDAASRSQWRVGIVVGLLATFGAVLVNTVLRLSGN